MHQKNKVAAGLLLDGRLAFGNRLHARDAEVEGHRQQAARSQRLASRAARSATNATSLRDETPVRRSRRQSRLRHILSAARAEEAHKTR
jgi:hypothetical protein